MFCARCGSQIEEGWVACPRCGQRYENNPQEEPYTSAHAPRAGSWYPNKRQWWAIWITAGLVVAGLLNGSDGVMFALSAAIVGGLIVWRLQQSSRS